MFFGATEMEKMVMKMPAFDLFGEQVITQRRGVEPRQRTARLLVVRESVQLAFIDLLAMSDEELEQQRQFDELTDDYIEWLRGYILKRTLRQLLHPQVSAEGRQDAYEWLMDDSIHPFSFRVCCEAHGTDYIEVRLGVESIMRKHMK